MSTSLAEGEKTSLSVRIPRQLKSRAWSVAQAQHVSFSAFVTTLIEKAVRETEQAATPVTPDSEWRTRNDRRIALIVRERDHGLTAEGQTELTRLQDEASLHVNQILSLPLDALEDNKELPLQDTPRG